MILAVISCIPSIGLKYMQFFGLNVCVVLYLIVAFFAAHIIPFGQDEFSLSRGCRPVSTIKIFWGSSEAHFLYL